MFIQHTNFVTFSKDIGRIWIKNSFISNIAKISTAFAEKQKGFLRELCKHMN